MVAAAVNHRPDCNACGGSVALSYGTAYYRSKADRALFEMAVRALAEGNALRATARIVQVDKDTVCARLYRVARHCRLVMLSLRHNLHVLECQLDELWSLETKEGASARREDLLRDIRRRLGVGGVCAGVAPRVGFRDWQAGPSQCRLADRHASPMSQMIVFRFSPVISCPSTSTPC